MRIAVLMLCLVAMCRGEKETAASPHPEKHPVKTHILNHPSGISATVSELGATLRTLSVPDRDGKAGNILVGFASPEEWLNNGPFFGSTVGRYANRIAGGKFPLDGKDYQLATNNGDNHLHGGRKGFDKMVWKTESVGESSIRFSLLSPDGDEGYPGNLNVTVEYILGERSLTWKATATTDKPTPVNLTNHAYFNLSGNPSASVLDHVLSIDAEKYLPVDETLIPTGELAPVASTGFDFTSPTSIGGNLAKLDGSFDHTFVLNHPEKIHPGAFVRDPASGRSMELSSDQPGLQLYLASPFGKKHSAFCLEPQHFPNSPNQANFPSPILKPGDTYSHTITLRFPEVD